MNLQHNIYKPQKFQKDGEYTGAAFGFQLFQPENGRPVFLMKCVKQRDWSDESGKGSFYNHKENPDKAISVKLNEIELGSLISVIRTYDEDGFSAFHTFGDDKTTISFKPYTKKDGKKAFSLTLKKNGALQIGMGVEKGEAESLRVLFEMALGEMFKG